MFSLFPASFCQKSRCGFTLFTVHTCSGMGLQVLPCVLHRFEVGEIFIKATQLPGVYKILGGFHVFPCALLTVLHHSLAACSVCHGKPMVKKMVYVQRIRFFNRVRATLTHGITDRHTDGIRLVRCASSEKIRNGAHPSHRYGTGCSDTGFLVRGILSRSVLDTWFLVRQIVYLRFSLTGR